MFCHILTTLCQIAPPTLADVWRFNTPSANIACTVGAGFERPEVPCPPTSAHALEAQSVADDGIKGAFGGFTCLSTSKGLDCRTEDGHGFFQSRKVQKLF